MQGPKSRERVWSEALWQDSRGSGARAQRLGARGLLISADGGSLATSRAFSNVAKLSSRFTRVRSARPSSRRTPGAQIFHLGIRRLPRGILGQAPFAGLHGLVDQL